MPASRGRPPQLKEAQLMQAALGIANAEGLSALTIRGVARACNVTPMAIYRHVTSVEDLEELAFRKAMQDMPAIDLLGSWRDQVKAIWATFRTMLLSHPGAAAIFAKRAMPTPEIIAATNQLFEVLEKAGLDGQQAFDVYDATFIFTLGSIRYEITRDKAVRVSLAQADGTKPAALLLSRHATRMQSRDPDRQFEIGLDMILSAAMGHK